MPDSQQLQQLPDAPPGDPQSYLSSLQSDNRPPGDPGQYLDKLHQQDAIDDINKSRDGKLNLSPTELAQRNLVAQGGKPLLARTFGKLKAVADGSGEWLKSVPGGVSKAVSDEYHKVKAMPYLDRLKYGASLPFQMSAKGVGETVRSLPGIAETMYKAGELWNPSTYIQEITTPQLAQESQASNSALFDYAQQMTSKATDAVESAAGIDENSLPVKVAGVVDPLVLTGAIPIGGAGAGIEKGVASLSENIVRGAERAGAGMNKVAASTVARAAPTIARAPKAAVGAGIGAVLGHGAVPSELAGALVGAAFPGVDMKANAIASMLKSRMSDVVSDADAVLKSPWGTPAWKAIQEAAQDEIAISDAKVAGWSKKLTAEDKEMLAAEKPKGGFLYDESDLTGLARKVREKQNIAANLREKVSAIAAREKANQFNDDIAKYLTGLGINATIGGTAGAGFAGAASPPNDDSQMGGSAMTGAMLGLGGGLFGVPKGMQAERAVQSAKAMNDIGSKIAPQDARLIPPAQESVNKLAAVAQASGTGGRIFLHSPEEYAQMLSQQQRPEVIPAVEGAPTEQTQTIQAPNGHLDQDNNFHLNIDALNNGTGVEWHEFEHLLQQLYGRALRTNAPPELAKNFDKAYKDAISSTGDIAHNAEVERDAEVGRILLQNTPIENFWSGKRIFDVLDPARALSWIGSKLLPGYKVDPTLQAPYNRGDVEAMRGQMFKAGEEAAKPHRNAPTESQATSIPQGEQTQPSATAEAPSKPVEQVVGEVEQIARPKVVPAGGVDPQDAVDFLVKMGQTKESAIAKAHAAVQDLKGEGTPVTLENIVKKAMQRAIPKPADVVGEVDQVAKATTPRTDEEPSRAPTETVPPEATEPTPERGVADEVQTSAEQSDHPDYEALRTEAETTKREELSGTRRKTKEQEIARAGLEAMAQAHAKHVEGNPDLVTWRTNKYGKQSISGRKLDPTDPFHAHLIEQANLSPEDANKLNFIESNMGKTISADYLHAPEEGEASGVTRKAEQGESTAPERVAGAKGARRLSKSFVPTGFTFNAPSKTFEVSGFSPDKFLKNAQMLIPWAKANGLKAWKDINDPSFATDFQNGVENHKNGYTLAGKPIEGTPLTRVKPNPDYEPHVLSKDKADLLNAMMGDTSARVVERKQAPYREAAKADKQILAQQNSPFWEPQTGEVNRIRAKLGDNAKLLESTFETLRPELIDNLRTDAVKDAQTLRPSGFEGDRGAFAEKGLPNSTMVGAGFMPSTKPPNFYSQLERTIESQPERASPEQLRAALRNTKQTEIRETKDALGVSFDQWLKDNPKATKGEMLDFVRENKVQINIKDAQHEQYDPDNDEIDDHAYTMAEEDGIDLYKLSQDEDNPKSHEIVNKYLKEAEEYLITRMTSGETKFHQYQLPGSIPGSYRETLATLPTTPDINQQVRQFARENNIANIQDAYDRYHREQRPYREMPDQFRSSHWDEPNVVLHLRSNERELPGGGKMLFLEELQSDWGARARKEGITTKSDKPEVREDVNVWVVKYPDGRAYDVPKTTLGVSNANDALTFANEHKSQLQYFNHIPTGVPDAPFIKGNAWKTLGLKIALRKAAESGAKALGWTTGEIQAERYDLSKQIDAIDYVKKKDGTYGIAAIKDGSQVLTQDNLTAEKLADHVGKDVAQKIINGEGEESSPREYKRLSGVDLKVGGTGMSGFYDKELVNLANDLVKKWGVRVGETEIPNAIEKKDYFETERTARKWAEKNLGDHEFRATKIADGQWDIYDEYDHKYVVPKSPAGVHSVPITDAMRRDILEKGQAMFMPATPKHLDAVAKELRLRYDGPSLGGKAHQFTDDKTKSSIDVPADATPEQVKAIFETSRRMHKEPPMQFMPKADDKRAIKSAAVRFPDGKIYSDWMHPMAFAEGVSHYSVDQLAKWIKERGGVVKVPKVSQPLRRVRVNA